MDLKLKDRIAVVTGSARGLGEEIARSLGKEGCTVVIADLDLVAARDTCERFLGDGIDAHALQLDVARASDVRAGFREIIGGFNRMDILVNNAGVIKTGSFVESSAKDWEQVTRVNLGGVYNCCREVLPSMIERRTGKIINIASVSAARGGGAIGNVLYGTTKAGVVAMTKGIAREVAPHGINVNAISPAVVNTSMTRDQLTTEVTERVESAIPMGRLGLSSEIGSVAAFLASDISSFTTGEEVVVDGGYLCS